MAVKTWFLKPEVTLASVNEGLTETSTGAESTPTPNTGWTVAKVAPTVYGSLTHATKAGSGVFTSTVVPSATFDPSSALISDTPYTGTFATGTWAATMKVIAVSSGGDQDGNLVYRLFRVTGFVGSGVELTSGVVTCGTVTNLATTLAQNSNGTTPSISTFSVTNEYIALVLAWEITGVGGANTRDVVLRKGSGITLVSPNFTPATLPFNSSEGEEHSDPRSLQVMDRVGVARGAFFMRKWQRSRSGLIVPSYA